MTDRVGVDASILWAAATRMRSLADHIANQLACRDAEVADCWRGWSTASRQAFDGFVDRSADSRRAMCLSLENLDEGLRAAAHGYEETEAATASNLSGADPRVAEALR